MKKKWVSFASTVLEPVHINFSISGIDFSLGVDQPILPLIVSYLRRYLEICLTKLYQNYRDFIYLISNQSCKLILNLTSESIEFDDDLVAVSPHSRLARLTLSTQN